MGDAELQAIRARRMAELQGAGGGGGGGVDPEQMKKQQEMMKQQEEMKNSMLAQLLDQGARGRLNNIALVNPEKAKAIESMLIQMAQRGQIGSKMSEELLISMLEKVKDQTKKPTVKIDRRRYAMDSDEDD